MPRVGRRVLMAAVGLCLLAAYATAAVVGYLALAAVWAARPDRVTTLAVIAALTVAFAVFTYRFGTAELLSSLDAVEVPRDRAPGLYARLDRLCGRMRLDPPRLLVGRLGAPNALSIGGRHPAIVIDRSLLRLLDADELEALLAHELAHLESRDGLAQTLGVSVLRTLAGAVLFALTPALLLVAGLARSIAWIRGRPKSWLATPFGRVYAHIGYVVAIVLALLTLALLAHSRRREFAADARAAEVTGDPRTLARTLYRIERAATPDRGLLSSLYVTGRDDDPARWLSTHPSLTERIEHLRRLADDDLGPRRVPVR